MGATHSFRPAALATLLVVASAASVAAEKADLAPGLACDGGGTRMARVDLFFGAAHVGRRTWRRFLATVVTPRFPDGLTSMDGRGQWRGPRGLVAEPARILVIYYRPARGTDARIEAIRTAYRTRFSQTSVLRADSSACVSF